MQRHLGGRPCKDLSLIHVIRFSLNYSTRQAYGLTSTTERGGKPYKPPREHRVGFVERLLTLPRVRTNDFRGLEPRTALERVLEDRLEEGSWLNEGNPWSGSCAPYDQLRGLLGYWKAPPWGPATRSCRERWLGYGVPTPFVCQPPGGPSYAFPTRAMPPDHARVLCAGGGAHAPGGRVVRSGASGLCAGLQPHEGREQGCGQAAAVR